MEGIMLYLLKTELSVIEKGKIEGLYRVENNLFVLSVSRLTKKIYISMSFSEEPFICLVDKENVPNKLEHMPSLEGNILDWEIVALSQDDLNRIYKIELAKKGQKRFLYLEFTGRFSNLIITDKDNVIITALKPMGFSLQESKRILRGGFPYKLPFFRDKYFPWELNLETLLLSGENKKVKDLLVKNLKGIGSFTAEDILVYLGYDKNIKTPLERGDIMKISQFLGEIYNKWLSYEYTPYIVYNEGEDPERISLLPIPNTREVFNLSEAIWEVNNVKTIKKIEEVKRHRLLKLIEENISSLEKKISDLQKELSLSQNAEVFLKKGETLKMNLSRIKKGMKRVEVINYYEYPPKKEYIELDPELSPKENVESYFKKYTKYKRGKDKIEKIYTHLKSELERVNSIRGRLLNGENLLWIEEELRFMKILKDRNPPVVYKGERLKIRRFMSPDGFLILVGRSAKDNEMILKLASPNDYWLHVRDIPGSHVIVKREGKKEIPFSTIRYAASIAAYYSKARNDKNVGVDYTLRKYVKPIKGAKSGFVNFREEKTIYVDPHEFKEESFSNHLSSNLKS